MKRRLPNSVLKKSLLAVPAAALMLGAAQAGTTIGLNFQAWYYDSLTTPQTIGFGQGYQTTGWPATARAFGVDVANWVNTEPMVADSNSYGSTDTNIPLGSITVHLTAVNMWTGDIGNLVDPANEWTPGYQSTVSPGNDEVTWSYEDNTGWTNDLSGLNTTFPNGYVIELIGAVKCTVNSRVAVTDGGITTSNAFDTIYTAGNANFNGPVGFLAISGTSDTLTFGAASRSINSAESCALAGFIITDQPVVSKDPESASVNQGGSLDLSARVVGVGTLSYQWRLDGGPITDATNATYTVLAATSDDAGDYDLVVTNLYGTTTSGVATVTVNTAPMITDDLAGETGTLYAGADFSQWSVGVAGAEPLHYSWFKNGTTPVGADSPTLSLTNVALSDSGTYHVFVTNLYGTATSATNTLTVVSSPDQYTTVVAQDSPSAYWPLGETSGTVAGDYSGAGHNGNISNSVTLGAIGPRPPTYAGFNSGKLAYQFDGVDSFVDCGTGPSLSGPTDFTVEAWVNTTATTEQAIVHQRGWDGGGYQGIYRLSIEVGGAPSFKIYNGGYQFELFASKVVNDGQWHHLAAVRRNGTEGELYIDGALAASGTGAVRDLDPAISTYIGYNFRDSSHAFGGSISDVAVYPYALSTSRIILHAYTGELGDAPFSISMVPGGFIEDTSPLSSPHLGMNNGSTWSNSVTDGNLVTRTGVQQFSGNSQITTAANPDFDSSVGTFTFWIRADAPLPGPGSEAAMIMDRRTSSGTIISLNNDGTLFVQCAGGANTYSAGYLPDNLWHLVGVTYNQSTNGFVGIYIDGVWYGDNPNTSAWSWPTNQEIELGKSHDGYWKRLNGEMDDFRIYNRVLTESEIASIYSSDALVDGAALMVRYNFDNAPGGMSLTWPVGILESSPTLGPSAVWTTVPGAIPPYPFLPPPPAAPDGSAVFYRAGF